MSGKAVRGACIGSCSCCDDPAYRKHEGKPLCQECFNEIVNGVIPRITPIQPRMTRVELADEAARHDAEYHGGRFHSAEW